MLAGRERRLHIQNVDVWGTASLPHSSDERPRSSGSLLIAFFSRWGELECNYQAYFSDRKKDGQILLFAINFDVNFIYN